jgi:Glycosyl hydrolase family 26
MRRPDYEPKYEYVGKDRSRPSRAPWLAVVSILGVCVLVIVVVVALKNPFKSGSAGSASSGGSVSTITAGDSKANCIDLQFNHGELDQSEISAATNLTGVTYNCLETFANPMPTWDEWETPWMFSNTYDGWDAWLAANPAHQVVMAMDLIPQSLFNEHDPLPWEQACAAGSYNQNATTLAKNLVSYGAGKIVIRLGPEANGAWEADYVGTTTTEMNDWAKCYDNEVTAMRAVPGAHFLFVWNPNACTTDLPLNEWYPGNSYVDIVGIDAYDQDCSTSKTVSQEGWAAFSTDTFGSDPTFPSIASIEAFAVAHGKPLSFPEWGLTGDQPDDAAYITDMAQMFKRDAFAFESYFDSGSDGIASLGSAIPNATAAYSKAFG